MYYMKLVRNSVASLFHMHAHSLQPFTVLTRCYLLAVHVLGMFLTTLNPKCLYIFFIMLLDNLPCNLHSINQRTEAVLQILVASFRFFQASQLTTRAVTYIRFIYLCSTFSISAFINEETSIGVSKVTSSSCQ